MLPLWPLQASLSESYGGKLGDSGVILTFDSETLGHVGCKPRQYCLSLFAVASTPVGMVSDRIGQKKVLMFVSPLVDLV